VLERLQRPLAPKARTLAPLASKNKDFFETEHLHVSPNITHCLLCRCSVQPRWLTAKPGDTLWRKEDHSHQRVKHQTVMLSTQLRPLQCKLITHKSLSLVDFLPLPGSKASHTFMERLADYCDTSSEGPVPFPLITSASAKSIKLILVGNRVRHRAVLPLVREGAGGCPSGGVDKTATEPRHGMP